MELGSIVGGSVVGVEREWSKTFWMKHPSIHLSIFICPIRNNQNANKRAVGQDSETTRVLNTALNTNKVL